MTHGEETAVWPELERRLHERLQVGRQRYGRPLMTHDGRDNLLDCWEEAADLLFYLTKELMEREAAADLLVKLTQALAEREARKEQP